MKRDNLAAPLGRWRNALVGGITMQPAHESGFSRASASRRDIQERSMNDPTFVGWELTRSPMKTDLISRLEETANSR